MAMMPIGALCRFGGLLKFVSNNPDMKIAERSYGYFPMANYLKMLPVRVSDDRFVDGAPTVPNCLPFIIVMTVLVRGR